MPIPEWIEKWLQKEDDELLYDTDPKVASTDSADPPDESALMLQLDLSDIE